MTPLLGGAALVILLALGVRARRQRRLLSDSGMVSRSWLVQHRASAQADHRFPS
jgi:hypothetical protein